MPPAALGLLLVVAVSFAVATILTPLVARLAVAQGWIDRPDDYRKLHRLPIPTVGGLAVGAGFVIALAIAPLAQGGFPRFPPPLALAGTAVAMVGLLDDLRGVRPRVKLAVQAAAAGFLYYNGFRIDILSNPFGDAIHMGALALPLTVLWLVGMSNAINLIDGLDGLAAGLALVATLGLLGAALVNGQGEAALVAAALAGALLGFLPYNFNPARVFLGDCGSLPIGFTLAAIAMHSSMKRSAAIAVAVPLLALALPLLDVGLAVIRRVVRRRPVFGADRDHIHHRLVEMGLTPRRAVITLYAVAVLFTGMALVLAAGPQQLVWAAGLVLVLVAWSGVRALGYWELTELQRSFISRLAAAMRASGDAALHGLEVELARPHHPDWGWDRLCATAWALGFRELHVVPTAETADVCPEWHAFATPLPLGEQLPIADEATWYFSLELGGEVVAEVVARRALDKVDFDPRRFVTAVQGVVLRRMDVAAPRRFAAAPKEVARANEPATAPGRAGSSSAGAFGSG